MGCVSWLPWAKGGWKTELSLSGAHVFEVPFWETQPFSLVTAEAPASQASGSRWGGHQQLCAEAVVGLTHGAVNGTPKNRCLTARKEAKRGL